MAYDEQTNISVIIITLSFSGYWIELRLLKAERLPVDMMLSGVLQPWPGSAAWEEQGVELPADKAPVVFGASRRKALAKSTVPGVPGTPTLDVALKKIKRFEYSKNQKQNKT